MRERGAQPAQRGRRRSRRLTARASCCPSPLRVRDAIASLRAKNLYAGVLSVEQPDGIYRGITEAVADKGYHNNQVMVDLEAIGVRSYISEPDRGQRNWKDNSERVTPCGARARPLVERRRRPGTDRDLAARRIVRVLRPGKAPGRFAAVLEIASPRSV